MTSPYMTVGVGLDLAFRVLQQFLHGHWVVSDIAIFVLKRDVKLQLTN